MIERRRLLLMRHGAVDYFDPHGRPYPPDEVPLTAAGIEQARAVGAAMLTAGIRIDRAITSGLARTRQTASHVLAAEAPPTARALGGIEEIRPGHLPSIAEPICAPHSLDAFEGPAPRETRFLQGETIGEMLDRTIAGPAAPACSEMTGILRCCAARRSQPRAALLVPDRAASLPRWAGAGHRLPQYHRCRHRARDSVVRVVNFCPIDTLQTTTRFRRWNICSRNNSGCARVRGDLRGHRMNQLGAVTGRHAFDVERLPPTSSSTCRISRAARGAAVPGRAIEPHVPLTTPTAKYVMRSKPGPAAKLLPSAHAVEREFHVMRSLAAQGIPVPWTLLLVEDESVIGRAFYLMQHVEGRIFWDQSLPELGRADRAAIYDEMNRVIARAAFGRRRARGPRGLRQGRQLFRAPDRPLEQAVPRLGDRARRGDGSADRMAAADISLRATRRRSSMATTGWTI